MEAVESVAVESRRGDVLSLGRGALRKGRGVEAAMFRPLRSGEVTFSAASVGGPVVVSRYASCRSERGLTTV